jgi:hypothetical protein
MTRAISDAVARWVRGRPIAFAALLYAGLALALLGPGLIPGHTTAGSDFLWSAAPWNTSRPPDVPAFGTNPELTDPAYVFEPFLQYTRGQLPHVPLWDPYIMAGRPYLANAQSAVFSAFSLPAYVLPFWWSLSVIACLKLFVAAMGTFLLARALGLRLAGALLAGVVFAFSLWFVVWLPWPLTAVWALVPWLLLATDRLVRRPGPLPAAALAALVAAQFLCGHPESSVHALLATGAFLVLRLVQARRGEGAAARARGGRAVAFFAGAIVCGTAIAAAAIVPFAEALTHSGDVALRNAAESTYTPRKFILALFLYDYWGRPTQTPIESFEIQRAFYVGALPLMLAATALIRRRDLGRVAIAGFALFVGLVVLGVPPVFDAFTALPGIHTLHNWRMTVLLVLCIALLAGWGLDDLLARRLTKRQTWWALGAAAALLMVPLVWVAFTHASSARFLGEALQVAWGFARQPPKGFPDTGPVIRLSALILWLTFAAASVVLLAAYLRRRFAAPAFAALAIALVVADLFRAGVGQTPAEPVAKATQPVTGAIHYLQAHRPARFVGPPPGLGPAPIPPDVSLRYGLYDARGYDYPVDKRYDRLWRRWVTKPDQFAVGQFLVRIDDRSLPVLSLLGVRDIIQQRGQLPPFGPGVRLAYDGADAQIYENGRALPRVFLPGEQRIVRGEGAALEAVGDPGLDGRRTLITEHRLPGLPSADHGAGVSGGSARIASYGPERVTVEVRATRRAELVLSDLSFPGWNATVDGRRSRVDRVDYLLRGVPVEPGVHRVEFRYQPRSWTIGWIVSLLALVALLAAVVAGLCGNRLRTARS